MISMIFFSLAAICNAIMDNLSHHWYKSIYNNISYIWNSME